MAFGVHSEVGKLRKVMVHRPGLEHQRLTPSTAQELLFDDVLWVPRAKAEHDMFCEAMRDRGVEVFYAEELLAQALADPKARAWISDRLLNELEVGITAAARAREWAEGADAAEVADLLIGGITKADVPEDLGLVWESADPTSMLLPPLYRTGTSVSVNTTAGSTESLLPTAFSPVGTLVPPLTIENFTCVAV